jgi:hypothetical protein
VLREVLEEVVLFKKKKLGVLGIRLTELKYVIGLTKLNYLELGHASIV